MAQVLRKPNGEVTKDVTKKLQIFEEYYSQLYAVEIDQQCNNDLLHLFGQPSQLNIDRPPHILSWRPYAIDTLKANKSHGLDGLSVERIL